MQLSLYDIVQGLTSKVPTIQDKSILLNKFAYEFGWTPSYNLAPSEEKKFVNTHLVVEHGLENSAIISFLNTPYLSLSSEEKKLLLNISYNNMVDWHIHVESDKVFYIYNRQNLNNNIIEEFSYGRDKYEKLRSDAFEKIIGTKVSPNLPPLDDALISTISNWKRLISAELNNEVSNESLSTLFNSIMFVRAIEDYSKRFYNDYSKTKTLLKAWKKEVPQSNENWVSKIFLTCLKKFGKTDIPEYLINFDELKIFNKLNKQIFSYLLFDFYDNKQASFYQYDFSIMSQHALSRIYEKYIAILKIEDTDQFSLFPRPPKEEVNKAYGAVYTPQYVARFFARFLKENLAPSQFKNLKTIDPAIGSGIFLRSLLELQCDPRQDGINHDLIKENFQNLSGVDVDENACKASQLSLALLQLILTGEFPKKLDIKCLEAISYFDSAESLKNSYDIVIANPPYISFSDQSKEIRDRIKKLMGSLAKGRTDTYLAFMKIGLDLLKPGGFGLFVVPHSFLLSSSASRMRDELSKSTVIKCVADLSAIPVFGDTGIYVSLIIFQKRREENDTNEKAIVIKCKEMVGRALNDAIQRDFKENDFYSVFEVGQDLFRSKEWNILPKSENDILIRLNTFPTLDKFLEVRQGFVTGNDKAFIVNSEDIPEGEESIFVPYLHDREMERYAVPSATKRSVFFPIIDGVKLTEEEIIENFPKTWEILSEHKNYNLSKKAFQNSEWWKPLRNRQPEHLLINKIVTPHLTIAPKFGLDLDGKYAVSRTPFIIPKNNDLNSTEMLMFFSAVLNSSTCYWYISNHSHVYKRGYTMLEVKTLSKTRVPDPAKVPPSIMRKILNLVNDRLRVSGYDAILIERQLDELIADLYLLNSNDKKVLGIEY